MRRKQLSVYIHKTLSITAVTVTSSFDGGQKPFFENEAGDVFDWTVNTVRIYIQLHSYPRVKTKLIF